MSLRPDPDAARFRSVMGCFATGVTILSAGRRASAHGMTANAFTSVSLDPPMVLGCVATSARLNECIERTGSFAVSILTADQQDVARFFARRTRDIGVEQFDAVGWHPGPRTGAPLVDAALAWLECDVAAVYPGGDHLIYLGRVTTCESGGPSLPLTFWCGRFGDLRVSAPSRGSV